MYLTTTALYERLEGRMGKFGFDAVLIKPFGFYSPKVTRCPIGFLKMIKPFWPFLPAMPMLKGHSAIRQLSCFAPMTPIFYKRAGLISSDLGFNAQRPSLSLAQATRTKRASLAEATNGT